MRTFNEIASEMLHIKIDLIEDSLTQKDIPDWDSMNYLLFISELEKEYGVTFTMDEVLKANSIGSVRSLLKTKGVKM